MSAYLAVLTARCRVLLQYRAAAAAGFATQVFWGLLRVMVFAAFYASTTTDQPMTYAQVVTYVWLGQALLRLLPFGMDREIEGMVRSGAVAYELLRPVDLYAFWFSREVANRLAPTLLRSLPMLVLAKLFFGLQFPASFASGAAWILTTASALLLSASIMTLTDVALLWTISGEGFARILPMLAFFLSGMIVPLPLFPEWAQPVLSALPFRGLVDTPFRLYMGHLPPGDVFRVLAHQGAWIGAFVVAGRTLLARGTRRLVVQGG